MSDAFDMPPPEAGFDVRAGWVLKRLMVDLAPLTPEQAAGIVGNLAYESGEFRHLQEIAPASGRGGYGWAQWTGPRRVAFENWCDDNGLSPASDEANYGFLVAELRGEIEGDDQSHSITQVRKTTTVDAATYTFEAVFERPANVAGTRTPRFRYAQRALVAARLGE